MFLFSSQLSGSLNARPTFKLASPLFLTYVIMHIFFTRPIILFSLHVFRQARRLLMQNLQKIFKQFWKSSKRLNALQQNGKQHMLHLFLRLFFLLGTYFCKLHIIISWHFNIHHFDISQYFRSAFFLSNLEHNCWY